MKNIYQNKQFLTASTAVALLLVSIQLSCTDLPVIEENFQGDDALINLILEESQGNTSVTEIGDSDEYIIKADKEPRADLTVTIDTDEQLAVDKREVTLTKENYSEGVSVQVTAIDDTDDESTIHKGRIEHNLVSADKKVYLEVDITDNDGDDALNGIEFVKTGGSNIVTEAGSTDNYTIRRNSEPASAISIDISPDGQLTTDKSSVEINSSNYSTGVDVTITAVDDDIDEADSHTGNIIHTIGSGTYSMEVTVTDNDTAGFTLANETGISIKEGETTHDYTIVLDSEPAHDVEIVIENSSSYPGELTFNGQSTETLVFTSANWNSPQTVTVGGDDDSDYEFSHTGEIIHTVTSSDTKYDNYVIANLNVDLEDNEGLMYLFMSSTTTDGNLTNNGGSSDPRTWADTTCASDGASHSNTDVNACSNYHALMSFSSTDTIANMINAPLNIPSAYPVLCTGGAQSGNQIFSDWNDIINGGGVPFTLDDCLGTSGVGYFSGSNADGSSDTTCTDWGTNSGNNATTGGTGFTNNSWIKSTNAASCSSTRNFLCICW